MRRVQPIRDERVIEGMKAYFRTRSMRNYLFFCIGIYSGLRVSDLRTLRVGDVRNATHVTITEKKNKRTKRFAIHPSYQEDLERYIANKRDDEYLFPSRQRKTISRLRNQPIDRSTAYRFLRQAGKIFGLKEIGNHTLRKTWGYRLWVKDKDNLALLMKAFGHSDYRVTLDYLCLTDDMLDEATYALK